MARSSRFGNPARRASIQPGSGTFKPVTAYQPADLAGSTGALKVFLDNNVWSHLADGHVTAEQLQVAVRDACGDSPVRIVASPAVLNELLENPNDASRTRAVRLISDPRWLRATREVELWVAELVEAAQLDFKKRHWVRHPPRLTQLAPHIDQWRRGIWRDPDAVRLDPTFAAHWPVKRAALITAKKESGFTKPRRVPDLHDLRVEPGSVYTASRRLWQIDDPIELWRPWSWSLWLNELSRSGHTVRVVADAYLRVESILGPDHAQFFRWWTIDLKPSSVPRTWLFWATQAVQSYQRGPDLGDLVDRSHATYLVDCDLFITCDAAFGRALQEVVKQAPFPTARPVTLVAAPFETLAERVAVAAASHLETMIL